MVDIAASSDLAGNMDHPMGMFLYTVSLMHCMPVGLADGGTGLGMMWGQEKAVSMLQDAGFGEVSVEAIPEDPFNLHFFCRKNAGVTCRHNTKAIVRALLPRFSEKTKVFLDGFETLIMGVLSASDSCSFFTQSREEL